MVLIERVRKRGANMVITADGEMLFGPTGPVPGFTRAFSNRARGFTIQAAPTNRRPRWGHYGLPLKRTIKASTRTDAKRMRAYAAIGSTAPHAAYVDQGTGVYNERSPYQAKVLPPWHRGDPSLYEHTWRPYGGEDRVDAVIIRGQRGQHFFDTGMQQAFAAAHMLTVMVPGSGPGKMSEAINSVPNELVGFLGNTVADGAFIASLTEWRAWRDEAFNAETRLGRGGGIRRRRVRASRARGRRPRTPTLAERRKQSARRSKKYRDRMKKAKSISKPPPRVRANNAKSRERSRFLAAALKKYGSAVLLDTLEFRDGYWYVTILQDTGFGIQQPRTIRGQHVDP